MTRWWLLLCLPLMGFTRLYDAHDSTDKVDSEFVNIETSQHTVFSSTPALKQMSDGQIAIISSMTFHNLIYRSNQEIYGINNSCITVIR